MTANSKRRAGELLGGQPVANPRPRLVEDRVQGVRCRACSYPTAPAAPWCPACQSLDLAEAFFGPGGIVWSSTVVHIPVGKWRPPYALAYVDLEDGPRVLAHLERAAVVPPGTRVRIIGDGEDIVVTTEVS
jgi:uncharacterized OB-fold protein